MNRTEKIFKATAAVAGILAVASALLMIVLIALAELGCINPRQIKLIVTTETLTREYDGSEMTGAVEVTYGKLAEGHQLEVLSQSSLSEVGQIENRAEIRITDATGADITEMYDIQYKYGYLTMEKRRINLKVSGSTKTYDGTPLSSSTIEDSNGRLSKGDSIQIINAPELVNVGMLENKVEFCIVNEKGEDITEMYDIRCIYGYLIMEKRQISLDISGASKIYDGLPLSSANVKDSNGRLATGDSIEIIGAPELVDVGSVKNNVEFCIVNKNGENVTDNYDIKLTVGNLTVNKRKLTINTGSAKKYYDGKELVCEEFTIVDGALSKLVQGHTVTVKDSSSITTVGKISNKLEFAIYDEHGNDMTNVYEITQKQGTLEIIGKNLVIATGSVEKQYDGTPLSNEQWSLKSGELDSGHKIRIAENTKLDGVGTVDNVLRLTIVDANGNDVTNRYSISYSYGTLSVTPARLTIKTGTSREPYTGSPITKNNYEIKEGTLCNGHKLSLVCKSRTERGYYSNSVVSYSVTVTLPNGTKKDVTACYQIVFEYGTLQIY